jgi:polysaccharide deacetylase 2 family uncharacterized protein YibQ
MGSDEARSQQILELPGPLTLSFLTYAPNLPVWARHARAAGHEILAHLPMEPLDPTVNPGPGALRVTMNAADVRAQIAANLDHWTGFVGASNHMGSRFCQDRKLMDAVMSELKARSLLWVDSRTTAATQGFAAAVAAGVPGASRDVFLDNVDTLDGVGAQLELLEAVCHEKGRALAIGHPRDSTIRALAGWLPTLAQRGLTLAPVSALIAMSSAFAKTPPRQ